MLILGDVAAAVAIVLWVGLGGWGAILAAALLFPKPTASCAREFERFSWRAFLIGLAVAVPGVSVSLIMLNLPNGFVKFLGFLGILAILAFVVLGLGGLARLFAERVQGAGGSTGLYGGLSKGSALIVLGGMMPLLGWFLVGPILMIAALGAAVKSLLFSAPVVAPTPAGLQP